MRCNDRHGVVLIRYSNSKNGQYSIWMGYDENVLTEYSTRQYIKRLNMQYVDTNRDLFKFLKHERLQILHISKELLKEEQKLADEENTKEIQNKLNEINNQISSLNYVASALENVNIELSELSVDNEDQKIRFIAGESDAGKLLDNLTLSFSTGDNLLSIGGDGRNNQIFLATWIAKQNIQKNVDHVTFYATKTISNINVKGLFSRKWDLVIDFDYDSDVTGLEKEYTKICGVVPWIRMLTKTEANRKFSISNLPYWIMANGCADDPDTIIDESRWKSKYGRYLSDVLEKFHEMYTKPVKVFIYPIDNEKNLERVVEAFDDVYESGDDADYYVLSAQGEYSRIDNGNFRILPLKFKEFCDNLLIHYEADRFIAKSYENQLPTVNKEMVLISEAFAAELRDSFEVVYVGVDRQEEYDATKTSRNYFYRGDIPISWYGLNHNFDVVRKIKTSIIDKIKTDMQDRGRLLKRVC